MSSNPTPPHIGMQQAETIGPGPQQGNAVVLPAPHQGRPVKVDAHCASAHVCLTPHRADEG